MTDVSMEASDTKAEHTNPSENDWPSTVVDGRKDDKPIYDLPYMGTAFQLPATEPTAPCGKDLESLRNEFKEYKLLRKKDEL